MNRQPGEVTSKIVMQCQNGFPLRISEISGSLGFEVVL